jgi:hypothetical protein
VAGHPEAGQVLGRQVDPAAPVVLGDVADEVGQLEGQPQLAGVLAGLWWIGRFQDRGQHRADDGRRALHVATQVLVGAVAVGAQVHGHRGKELLEVAHRQVEGPDGVNHRRQQRVIDRDPPEAGEQAPAQGVQGGRLGGAVQGRGEVVDDLVGVAAEPVPGVHVAALPARQQQGGQVVGAAMAGMQLPTPLIGRRQRLWLGCRPRPQHEPRSNVTTA